MPGLFSSTTFPTHSAQDADQQSDYRADGTGDEEANHAEHDACQTAQIRPPLDRRYVALQPLPES